MSEATVWMPGSPGRWPFAGHVRGAWKAPAPAQGVSPLHLAWAGRIAGSCAPEEAWEGAEALRSALSEATRGIVVLAAPTLAAPGLAPATATTGALARIWSHLRALPARWIAREDASLLIVARDDRGTWLSGFGLEGVMVETASGWVAAALAGSPLLGEPGLPVADVPAQPPSRPGVRFVALPPGVALPPSEALAGACGVHP